MFTFAIVDGSLIIDTPDNSPHETTYSLHKIVEQIAASTGKIIIKSYRADSIGFILSSVVDNRTITNIEFVTPNITPEHIKILAGSAVNTIKIDYVCDDVVVESLEILKMQLISLDISGVSINCNMCVFVAAMVSESTIKNLSIRVHSTDAVCGETKFMIDLLKLSLDSLTVRVSQSIGGQDFDAYELEALGNCNIDTLTFVDKRFSKDDFEKTVASLKRSKVNKFFLKDCWYGDVDLGGFHKTLEDMHTVLLSQRSQ